MIMQKTPESKGELTPAFDCFRTFGFHKGADFIIVLEFISILNVFDVHFII